MKKLYLLFLLLPILFLTACTAGSYTVITAAEAKEMLDSDSSIILVDVRTQAEYDQIHIPGATLVPVDNIQTLAATLLPDKSATYIIYCNSGNRSATASQALVDLGYRNIYDMGGIIYWPYETIS